MAQTKAKTPAKLWLDHLMQYDDEKKALAAKHPAIVIGAKVTINDGECEAWYSGYGSNPEFDNFKPGMVGTIGAIAVAKVSGPRNPPRNWCPYYICIDYVDSNGHEVRCKAEYAQVEVLKDEA